GPRSLALDQLSLEGPLKVGLKNATTTASGARLDARIRARAVYLVLGSAGRRPRRVRISLDGHRVRTLTVRDQKLYTLVSLPTAGEHRLRLRLGGGISAYASTFG